MTNPILEIIQIIMTQLFNPMKEALEEINFLASHFYVNGIATSWAEIISMFLSLGLFFTVIFAPIYLVYKVVKKIWP